MLRKCRNLCGTYTAKNFRSAYFYAAILLFAFILLLAVSDDYSNGFGEGIHYYLHYAFLNKYNAFLAIICSIPAVLEFSIEWRNDAFIYYYSRAGKIAYAFSICFSAAITAIVIVFAGSILFIMFLALREPFYPGNEILLSTCIKSYAYGFLMGEGHYVLYYLLTVMLQGIMGAFYATAAVFVSTILIDPYLCLIVPMVISVYGTALIDSVGIPRVINPEYVFSNNIVLNYLINPAKLYQPSWFAICYPYLYTLLSLVIFGLLTFLSIKKRLERTSQK